MSVPPLTRISDRLEPDAVQAIECMVPAEIRLDEWRHLRPRRERRRRRRLPPRTPPGARHLTLVPARHLTLVPSIGDPLNPSD